MYWIRWRDHIEIALLALLLYGVGAMVLSRVTPAQQHEIELRAGLEQLYLMEQAHFAAQTRYFDPTDATEGLEWRWMDGYDWDYRGYETECWLVVRADLNNDGRLGAWGIDSRGPEARQLMED